MEGPYAEMPLETRVRAPYAPELDLPPPFRLVQRRYAQTYTLVRYRTPRAARVTPALLARLAAPIVFAPLVLVQR